MTELSKPDHGTVVEKGIMVEMRDGTRLATDVYRPTWEDEAIEGPLPTILQRTPYDKEDPTRVRDLGEWFSRRGYAVAIQDFRGRYGSEGRFYKYADMGEDGYDTTEWIARQPWSDGRIGTVGTSFMAHFQLALACMSPPHLTTMIVNQGGFTKAYLSACRHNGAFELRQLTWTFNAAKTSREAAADPEIRAALESVDPADYLDPGRQPLREGESPLSLVPDYERFYFDMLTEARYTDYWRRVGLNAELYYDRVPDVPVLLLGGWYDSYTRTTCDLYRGLSAAKRGPIRLIMGPWTHGWSSLEHGSAGEVSFGPQGSIEGTGLAPTANELALRWFDHWLKGKDTGIDGIPPVNIFVMGGGDGRRSRQGTMSHGGAWRSEQEWPPRDAEYTDYYLHGDGTLSTERPLKDKKPRSYTYDPRRPVPTIGGNISSAHGVMMPGAYDQVERDGVLGCSPPYRPLSSRSDVLAYSTEPLERDVEVTGPITATLWVSTSARDTDFTLKLVDLHPPNPDYPRGFAMNVSDTIFRARFHSSWERPELLEPGARYRLEMVSYPTSNLFKAGNRIRVDISSSNYPRFDLNPNTGEPLGRSERVEVAHQKIHHDPQHQSRITLPVIPRGRNRRQP
jgi:putative CocE/NonD family hydrolase